MRSAPTCSLLLGILLFSGGCHALAQASSGSGSAHAAGQGLAARAQTADLADAISVSLAELERQVETATDYRLIKAEQIVANGRFVWRITYKPASLLPADPSDATIGVGGEVFVNVDLDRNQTTVWHGE